MANMTKAKHASPDSASAAVEASPKAPENPLALAASAPFVFGFLAGRMTERSEA